MERVSLEQVKQQYALDLTHRILCRLLSDQACPEFHRRADVALTSTLGPEDWRLLAATARREGVAPLLYHTLNAAEWSSDIPPDVQADLRQTYYATTAVNLLVYRELTRILTTLSPLMALIALAIKLDDGAPVLYVQERVGKDGKTFRCHKFRTPGLSSVEGMVVDAENKGLGLEVAKNDPRITRVGRFLRHWTLDEIPQLFNVLKGDMSIVGPRPTVPSQVARYTPWQRRLEMKPGMAGWAWIHARNNPPWAERIELDVWYVDHWSLRLDLYILLKAFLMLFRREGLYGVDGVVRDLE